MNNKAEINNVFLGAIIFAALVGIIFIGPLGWFEKPKSLVDNLPDFNTTLENQTTIGLTRYDIVGNSLQVYDGESWIEFTGTREFDFLKSPVNSEELRKTFESYYFDTQRTGEREVYKNTKNSAVISGLSRASVGNIDIDWYEEYSLTGMINQMVSLAEQQPGYKQTVNYQRGSLILTIWNLNEAGEKQNIHGFIFIGLTAEDYSKETVLFEAADKTITKLLFGETVAFDGSEYPIIYMKAKEWRDSVFKEPSITIQGKTVCLRQIGESYLVNGRYIVVDLNKAGENCNV